jgi:predicted amidohydrolase YtcJ
MRETVYHGGPILTMDAAAPRAGALLTAGDRVIAAGDLKDVMSLAEDPLMVDLEGRTLMPAFVDAHSHMAGMGLYAQRCDLEGCEDLEELLERIRRYRLEKGLVHGELIRCRGYDPALMKEGRHPDAALLDSLGIDNPVCCVHQSGHMLACNTAAMRAAGVDDSFVCPPGGYAARDEHGRLTGYFEEAAQAPVSRVFETFSSAQIEEAILEAQDYYLRRGVTTIQDGSGCGPERFACFERLAEAGRLKADVVVYIGHRPEYADFWRYAKERYGGAYRGHLKLGGIKLVLDGSPQARTAWMRRPYEGGDPDYRGYPAFSDEYVLDVLCRSIDAGLQPLAHCNGDAAAEQFLSAWERAVRLKGHGQELRPVMIHAQTVGYDQLDRMGAVGMMPSFFIGHCYFWGDTHLKNFGKERGMRISPVNAAMDRGLPFSFHQDSPVTKPDMLFSVWCAAERLTRSGVRIGPENRVSAFDALTGVTRGAAYGYFEEDVKGVLKPGAFADLVLLDRDPAAVPPGEIKNIKVLKTICKGAELLP